MSFLIPQAVGYKDKMGKSQKSRLLTSGFWGTSRHMNYACELMIALSWCLPGTSAPLVWPVFMYLAFMVVLMFHRLLRDEDKCRSKYGAGWQRYCEVVRYRLVPGIF